jgi:hypothetical protein
MAGNMPDKLAEFLAEIKDLAKKHDLVIIETGKRMMGQKLCMVIRIEDWFDKPKEEMK